jgi:hypothetical protein
MGEQVQDGVGDHALRRLDAAEQQHGGVGDHALALQPAGLAGRGGDERGGGLALERRADRPTAPRTRAPVGVRAAGGDIRHRRHDPVVPAEHRVYVGALEAQRGGDDRDVQRREPRHGLTLAQAREQRVGVLLELLEAGAGA